MVNIAALWFSITGLGNVLRQGSDEDVRMNFTWDYTNWQYYPRTMLPSVLTVLGALLFAAACISTACFKFGSAACAVGGCIGGVILVIAVVCRLDLHCH